MEEIAALVDAMLDDAGVGNEGSVEAARSAPGAQRQGEGMSAATSSESPAYAFQYRRRFGGFEVWLWTGGAGMNLSVSREGGGAGYPATLELARAWARRHAFRSGIRFAEMPKRKREPKGPPPTPEQQERWRVGFLDARAQEHFDADPGHAAELWIGSARTIVGLTKHRPDKARIHARTALGRIKNARTCLDRWEAILRETKPVRRLNLVARSGERTPP